MKKFKSLFLCGVALAVALTFSACGNPKETVTLGSYNSTSQTFTALGQNAEYSLEQNGYTLTLKGKIPYSESILGIDAGNIVAVRFVAPEGTDIDGEASVQTTNRQDASANGWNTYGEEAFEADGSLIWVTSVKKDADVQIKIKWNKDTAEVTYTLRVDTNAEMLTA